MYRALSLSLAAHAALIAALLALSATRPTLRLPEVVRPVRLLASLEPPAPAAPRARAARPVEPAPAPAPPVRPAERAPRPRVADAAPTRDAAATARTIVPVAIPRIVIPTGEPAPAAPTRGATQPAAPDTALRERLVRRLSAPAGERRSEEPDAAPQIASLPRPEAAAPPLPAPVATAAAAGAVPPAGPVQPVGYFPHAWYLAVLKERIFTRWAPPSEFYVGSGSVAALVSFRIDRAGRISGTAVKESSGHARFDRSALAAIQSLAQLPALPEHYAEETLDVVIRFQNE